MGVEGRALQKATEASIADDGTVAVDHLASTDGGVHLAGYGQAFIWRKSRAAVQFRDRERARRARIEENEIGVRARPNVALARPESEDLRRIRGEQPDQVAERHLMLQHAEGIDQQQGSLDAADARPDPPEASEPL